MTTTTETSPQVVHGRRSRIGFVRKTAFMGGLFYLITFASSIPAVFLLDPVLNDANYVIGSGADTQVVWGNVLDLVNALGCIGSAVALFPIVKRQSESLALGFVTTRMFEAAIIGVGILSLLTVVSLRQPGATGAEANSLVAMGQSLVATYNWAFLLGPNVMAGLNALLLGTLMYKSGLVPRVIPAMGLVGAPLLLGVTLATMFGLTDHGSLWWLVVAPIFFWELSLGLYLAAKGFKPSPITAELIALEGSVSA